MVFEDRYNRIRETFFNEYRDEYKFSIDFYSDFIPLKDLGIICLSWSLSLYKITDEKKWAIARIKYGI